MQHQNYWQITTYGHNFEPAKELDKDIETDFLIIWWWMSGLSSAYHLLQTGKKIVLIESWTIGSWASGRSGGFLTPDSELELYQMERRYGKEIAKQLRDFWDEGQKRIVETAKKHQFDCDLQMQDSLFVWLGKSGHEDVAFEASVRDEYDLQYSIETDKDLKQRIDHDAYCAWLRYADSYSINPLLFVLSLKKYLIERGVEIYEHSAIKKIKHKKAFTHHFSIHFDTCVMCCSGGHITSEQKQQTYWVRNVICVSEKLLPEQIEQLYPKWPCMTRDNEMIFSYYRLLWDGRLLLWWWNTLTTMSPYSILWKTTIEAVIQKHRERLPVLKDIDFPYWRDGRIHTTKDMMPVVDIDQRNPDIIWVVWALGLPWAASCGKYAAQLATKEKSTWNVLSWDRHYLIDRDSSLDLLKLPIFWLNMIYAKYYQ